MTFLDPGALGGGGRGRRGGQGGSGGGKQDWGTGIAQRPFRVGSPTFFNSNPNINIPGSTNLTDDNDLSDIGSDDDVTDDDGDIFGSSPTPSAAARAKKKKGSSPPFTGSSDNDQAGVRIQFHGDHVAEAIEDETQQKKRVESMQKVSTIVLTLAFLNTVPKFSLYDQIECPMCIVGFSKPAHHEEYPHAIPTQAINTKFP